MFQTIIVALLVAVAVFFSVRGLVRILKGKRGCNCGCDCNCDKCHLKNCDKKDIPSPPSTRT
ncbi:MAG: FeoB-associated Cys-rich membrane protein [Bacteroidales bacterium]|nr:FeoB-associated Cys-rich membrane protein [Bacteroidales bacterium]